MYMRYWNLRRKPFGTAFVPDLVLFTQGFGEIYRTVYVASRLEPSCQWITGPEGCGKSTLLHGLKSGLSGDLGFKLVPGRLLHDEKRFLTALGGDAGDREWSGGLARRMEQLFLGEDWTGGPLVIAIDDSDLIEDDSTIEQCLRLNEICAERTWPLTVIFAGQNIPPSLEQRPSAPAVRHRLAPPSDEEAVEIIMLRLQRCGAGKRIITDNAVKSAVTEAEGNLSQLMMICDLSLQFGFETGSRRIDEHLLRDKVLPFIRQFTLDEQRFVRASAVAERRTLAEMPENPLGLRIIAGTGEPPEKREESPFPSAEEAPVAAEKSIESEENALPASEKEMENESEQEDKPEAEPEEKPVNIAFFHAGLETYKNDYLGQSTDAEEETEPESTKEVVGQISGPMTNQMLYNFAVWLMKDVLDRLRRLEHVDIGPIRELSETINKRLAEDDSILRLVLGESEAYDIETHLVNVTTLAVATGRQLKMSEEDLHMLGTTALLHDVGHLHCGEELLHSENRFDRLDFKKIKQHPQVGHDLILRQTNAPELIADIILQEHERDDGLGYPNYLGSEEIHPFAKIIGLCDFFEALTNSRAHRRPLKPAEALSEIRESRTHLSERRLVAALSNAVLDALSKARR